MTDIADELTRLSPQQRLELIERLWDSLDDQQIPVTEAQKSELDRRLAEFDQDRKDSVGWDRLRAELREQR